MLLSLVDFLYSFYARVSSFPFIIQVCIIFILSCILLFATFFTTISWIRYQFNRKKAKEDRLIPVLDELILKHLLDEGSTASLQSINAEFTEAVGKLTKGNLNLITDRLIFYKLNYDLNVSQPFYRIIEALRLEKHIEKKFDFSSSFDKMKGIQELSALAITAAESSIFPFTYSGNRNIRREARTSYLRLSRNDPFKFFDEATEPINNWDKINLLKQLMGVENVVIPNFGKWVAYSTNDSIVDFSIKMCGYFNQIESIPVLIDFLKTTNHELRAEAIKSLGILKAVETEHMLKEMYINQPDICQVEIIRAIGAFKTGNSVSFLIDAFERSVTVDTQKVAAEALFNYSDEGRNAFVHLKTEKKDFTGRILEHIENPLIKFK